MARLSDETRRAAWESLDANYIALRIKQGRSLHKMSMADFDCALDNVMDKQLDEYERTEGLPTQEFWTSAARVLKISLHWILTGEPVTDNDRAASGLLVQL